MHAPQKFLEQVRAEVGDDAKVKDGKFGAKMDVDICNDGPVCPAPQPPPPAMCLRSAPTNATPRPRASCHAI